MALQQNNPPQSPIIPLPPNTGETPRLVSQTDFEAHKKDFKFQKEILNWTFGFIVAILIVCFTSFIFLSIDAWKFHSDTTKEFQKTIQELKNNNTDLKFEFLKNKIDFLEKELDKSKEVKKTSDKK